jgi:hypothetical protein
MKRINKKRKLNLEKRNQMEKKVQRNVSSVASFKRLKEDVE